MNMNSPEQKEPAKTWIGKLDFFYKELKQTLHTTPKTVKLIWLASSGLLCISFLLTFISSFYPATSLWITKLTIDRITQAVQQRAAGTTVDFKVIVILLICMGAAWLLSSLIGSLKTVTDGLLQARSSQFIQEKIIQKCAGLDMAFYDNPKNLNLLDNANQGAGYASWGLISSLFGITSTTIGLGTFLVILIRLHWLATLIVAVTAAPQMIISSRFARRRWKMMTGRSEESRLRYYCSNILTGSHSAKEVRAFGLAAYLFERFKYFCDKFINQEQALTRRRELANFLARVLSNLGAMTVWYYIAMQAVAGKITIGDVVLYTGAISSLQGNLIWLFSQSGEYYQQTLFISNLLDFLKITPPDVEGALRSLQATEQSTGDLSAPPAFRHTIEFRNVSFHYPASDKWILRNLSFVIRPGESIALVGRNGAGKTTLVKLLIRLYDPTEGAILLDGRDLREYEIHSLRRLFGVIFQDYMCYWLTLRENIGFGDVEHVEDMERIIQASQSAGIDEAAQKLPDQYETYLCKQYISKGADLSGGEWQKVALARAYMRDCPILVLDEPTAGLDAFAEFEVYQAFDKLSANKTVLFISHRFSTVRMAKNILVLDDGKLVEEGNHATLIESNGLYASMFETQASRYR